MILWAVEAGAGADHESLTQHFFNFTLLLEFFVFLLCLAGHSHTASNVSAVTALDWCWCEIPIGTEVLRRNLPARISVQDQSLRC